MLTGNPMEKVQYHTIRDDWRMNGAIERIRVREVLEPLELSLESRGDKPENEWENGVESHKGEDSTKPATPWLADSKR